MSIYSLYDMHTPTHTLTHTPTPSYTHMLTLTAGQDINTRLSVNSMVTYCLRQVEQNLCEQEDTLGNSVSGWLM